MRVTWAVFKEFIQARSLRLQYVDIYNTYWMKCFDGPFSLECIIDKTDPKNDDQLDFETNFQSLSNRSFSDSDGTPLQRFKIAAAGAKFRLHGIKFITADLDSLNERKCGGTSYGWSTLKLYDADDVEITSAENESNAVKTVIQFEPPKNYEIIGGRLYQKSIPTESIGCCAIFAPTIPEEYGGKVHFLSECDVSFLPAGLALDMDGRVPKLITYDPVYHSGRFDFVFHHSAGFQHDLLIQVQIFEP